MNNDRTNWTWEIVSMLAKGIAEYQKGRKRPTILEHSTQEFFEKMASPRVLSTHLQFHHIPDDIKRRKCKIVYVQRNPKDVCVSFHKFMQSEMNSDISWDEYVHLFANADEGTNWIWEIVNMLVRETAEYQKDRKTPTILELQTQDYFDKMTSPRILSTHLRFHHIPNDIKKRKCKIVYIQRNPKDVAVSFHHHIKCEAELDVQWEDYLNLFVNADEGEVADWKNHFTVAQNEYFDKVMSERLKDTQLEFIYEI
ncbi:hypothetical protein KUTeg_013786 [Tegillarca granosa]|uniref:Sulfotransferase domain-containing protein n=1 Tax=Tegillarca granosa TaxID=220873 RepID=A0ABQ9EY40_TEGGR|nr:hypothetical protein KUTeg_013786 [Tegillarca granosa]